MNDPILDLEKRKRFWDKRESRGPKVEHDLSDSLPYPFEPAIQTIFDGKNVLEIGPGNGRQYERLRHRVKSYCVADISASALSEPVFDTADGRFLLETWERPVGRMFNVIHFWYVLHHIRLGEMRAFFAFVNKNLVNGGLVAFNNPEPINVQGQREGDGQGTTYSDVAIVQECSWPLEMLMALPVNMKSTGYVFLLRKVQEWK